MKTLGIIGGLGPMATTYYMRRVIEMTKAETDQQHLEMIVMNCPSIPDRTSYILDRSKPSPLPPIIKLAGQLEELGAGCLAIPCVTSHFFYEEFAACVRIPFLNMLRETVRHLNENGVQTVGILATTGTVNTGLFQSVLSQAGIRFVCPDEKRQTFVMRLIYDCIKAGRPADLSLFEEASDFLFRQGSEVNLLGCTELSLLKREHAVGPGFLDTIDVLAKASVTACGAPLREEFEYLITKTPPAT